MLANVRFQFTEGTKCGNPPETSAYKHLLSAARANIFLQLSAVSKSVQAGFNWVGMAVREGHGIKLYFHAGRTDAGFQVDLRPVPDFHAQVLDLVSPFSFYISAKVSALLSPSLFGQCHLRMQQGDLWWERCVNWVQTAIQYPKT